MTKDQTSFVKRIRNGVKILKLIEGVVDFCTFEIEIYKD